MVPPPSSPQLDLPALMPSPGRVSWSKLAGAERVRYAYSGRAAIYQYFASLPSDTRASKRPTVLVPAFHCPTVVDPVVHAGFDVRFYAIEPTLRIGAGDFLAKLDDSVVAAIFIRYFGFPDMPKELVLACRESGVRIVEDCSHSFLSANPLRLAESDSDAITFSFWKLLPTKVGGGVLLKGPTRQPWPAVRRPDLRDSWLCMKGLSLDVLTETLDGISRKVIGKRQRDESNGAPPIPAVRRPAGEAYPYNATASTWTMPGPAKLVLWAADLHRMVESRRRNFEILATRVAPTSEIQPVYPHLGEDVCPWGFPVLLNKRPERDYLIRARGVPVFTFGEVLHPLLFTNHGSETLMLDMARHLSDSLLTVAIHQQLEGEQVADFGRTINEFMSCL